jgi:hypothetical protein
MKKNKYLIAATITILVLSGVWLFYRHHQATSDTSKLDTAYSELSSERTGLNPSKEVK